MRFNPGGKLMRISVWLAAIALVGLNQASSARPQYSIMPAVIGNTIASMSNGAPKGCLALEWKAKPEAIARFEAEADPAINAYLALASKGVDPTPAYKRRFPGPWQLDGDIPPDLHLIKDPWAPRIARLERTGIMLGLDEVFGHAVWRAYDAAGNLLGTYDADLIRKTKGYAVSRLELWSPGHEAQVRPVSPFCDQVGDHEEWLAYRKAAADKKAKREAARAARSN
jgi:hypothetical protein